MHPLHVLKAEKPRYIVERPSEIVELLEKKEAERLSVSSTVMAGASSL
jgi:hypothetical protein